MPPRAAAPRGGSRGSGAASAGGGAKRTVFSLVTTPAKASDADQGGGGNKYAKLQKLTPSKAKKSSALRVSLTRDRAEVTNFRVCCCGRVPCWMIPHANAAGDLPFQSQVDGRVPRLDSGLAATRRYAMCIYPRKSEASRA